MIDGMSHSIRAGELTCAACGKPIAHIEGRITPHQCTAMIEDFDEQVRRIVREEMNRVIVPRKEQTQFGTMGLCGDAACMQRCVTPLNCRKWQGRSP